MLLKGGLTVSHFKMRIKWVQDFSYQFRKHSMPTTQHQGNRGFIIYSNHFNISHSHNITPTHTHFPCQQLSAFLSLSLEPPWNTDKEPGEITDACKILKERKVGACNTSIHYVMVTVTGTITHLLLPFDFMHINKYWYVGSCIYSKVICRVILLQNSLWSTQCVPNTLLKPPHSCFPSKPLLIWYDEPTKSVWMNLYIVRQ